MKKILMIIGLLIVSFTLCGCNQQVFDLEYTFNKAYCNYNGDKFELKIDKWNDYEDGEQIQVKSNGKVYLLSANNCYLVKE